MNWPRPACTTRVKGEPEAMVHRSRSISVCILLLCGLFVPGRVAAQAWFTASTGLGVDKPRVAVADFAPRADNAKSHSQLFTQFVREDLQFIDILYLHGPIWSGPVRRWLHRGRSRFGAPSPQR